MPSQYEIDTKFVGFLLKISLTLCFFSLVFYTAISRNIKTVESMYIIFVMLLILFLAAVFGLFVEWFRKYRTSLLKIN